ncbi:MAG: hypothetical protein ACOYXR_07405 [Nitrospirota bacterium]
MPKDGTTTTKGGSLDFDATVIDAGPGVTWSVIGGTAYGTIDADGVYTAPNTVPDDSPIIRATSTDDPRGTITQSIRVVVGTQLEPQANAALPVGASGASAGTLSGGQRSTALYGSTVYYVWSENLSGLERVYLSVSRDRGQTFSPPSQLSPTTTTHPHRYPSVAVDAAGRAVVVWVGSPDGVQWEVYARGVGLNASGSVVLGPSQFVALMGAVGDPLVALAVAPQGTACFAWVAQGASDTAIFLALGELTDSGTFTISSPVQASGPTALHPIRPAVAVNDRGSIVVAWSDTRDDPSEGSNDVWWRRARMSGGAIELVASETRVNAVVAGPQALASVAVGSSGMAVVAWSDGRTATLRRHVYFASSSAEGLGVTDNVLVIDDAGLGSEQNFPSVALGADGEVTVAFADNRKCIEISGSPSTCPIADDGTGQTDIYVARRLAGQTTFSQNVRVNDDSMLLGVQQHGRPSVAVDDVGRAMVLWTDDREGSSKPFTARVE